MHNTLQLYKKVEYRFFDSSVIKIDDDSRAYPHYNRTVIGLRFLIIVAIIRR